MKRHLLIACFVSAAFSVKAQQQPSGLFIRRQPDKHHSFINSLLATQAGMPPAQKPTGTQQRLIAEIMVSATHGIQDTMTYKYSGTRGSTYNHNRIDNFGYLSYSRSEYLPTAYASMNGLINNVLADSSVQYDNNEPFNVLHAFYRPDNKIDSFHIFYEGGTATDRERTTHVYNSSGRMTQYVNLNNFMNPPGFDTGALRKMVYDAAGTQLLRDTLYGQDINGIAPHYITHYHYNTQGDLDSITEYTYGDDTTILLRQTAIAYDAGNRINRILQRQYIQSDTTIATDTFGYTGSLPFFTFYENRFQWQDQTSRRRMIKHVGGNNLPDSVVVYSEINGPLDVEVILKYTYNSYNNPEAIMGISPDGTYAGRYNFYYETYDGGNNVGIPDAAARKAFSVYPNPFGGVININWKNEKTMATISLVNIAGQTVFSAHKDLATGSNGIDVPGLSDGNYILRIQDEKGNIYSGKLSKR